MTKHCRLQFSERHRGSSSGGRKDIYSIFLEADSYFGFLGSITVMYGFWDERSTAAVKITIPFPSQT
jgi:hypothetical protein